MIKFRKIMSLALLLVIILRNINFVNAIEPRSNFEQESNDSKDYANSINLNTTYYEMTESYNYDYLKLSIPSDGYIDLKFNSNENIRFNVIHKVKY